MIVFSDGGNVPDPSRPENSRNNTEKCGNFYFGLMTKSANEAIKMELSEDVVTRFEPRHGIFRKEPN